MFLEIYSALKFDIKEFNTQISKFCLPKGAREIEEALMIIPKLNLDAKL